MVNLVYISCKGIFQISFFKVFFFFQSLKRDENGSHCISPENVRAMKSLYLRVFKFLRIGRLNQLARCAAPKIEI
jgi:hypothetical protein